MMKKILVPFDGSETALRALEFAAGIGKPFGSEIMVVNVIVPYDYTKVPPRKPKNAIEEAEMAAKEPDPTPLDIAKGILDKLGCTTASYRLIVDIDPAERILEYAKTAEADMIQCAPICRDSVHAFRQNQDPAKSALLLLSSAVFLQ